MNTVRCSCCRRKFAYASDTRGAIFCRPWCARVRRTSDNEVRDGVMAYLHTKNAERWNPVALALHFDLSRQRVEKILTDRQVLSPRRPRRAIEGDST